MTLASLLKQDGHTVKVVIGGEQEVIHRLHLIDPDLIAFSATANEHRWVIAMARLIRERFSHTVPVIVGGPLATFSPSIIEDPAIDMICRGEGEEALRELAAAFDSSDATEAIPNIWVKQNGQILKNDMRPLLADLDALPFVDRDLYGDYRFIHSDPTARIMVGRGCPYSCSFCFDPPYRKLYESVGYIIRRRSAENIAEEVNLLVNKYRKKLIWFVDDIFPLHDTAWLGTLLECFNRDGGLPFICHTRVELIDEEGIKMLNECGLCANISFGVESGDEVYRKTILKKGFSNERVRYAAGLLKKYRLCFSTTNMMGMPGETMEAAVSTIKLNRQIKPDFSVCTVYQPLPTTELSDFALDRKYIVEEAFSKIPLFSHEKSLLCQKDIVQLVNLHKFFYILFYLPWLEPMVRRISRLPNNFVYNLLYKFSYLICYMRKIHHFRWRRLLHEGMIGFRYYRDRW